MTSLQIDARFAAPFSKGTTGLVERTNQTVETMLRCYATDYNDWHRTLPLVEYFINCTPTSATGLSPFEAVMAFNPPRGHIDTDMRGPVDSSPLVEKIREIKDYVTTKLLEAQRQMRLREAHRTTPPAPKYSVGDWVYVDASHIRFEGAANNKKMRARAVGPFPVEAVLREDTYALELPDDMNITNVFDVGRLKPCDRQRLDTDIGPDGIERIVYEVDELLSHTERGRGRAKVVDGVLVSFKGYDESYNLWQPVHELAETAAELLQAYLDSHGLAVDARTTRILRQHLSPPPGDVPVSDSNSV